MIIEDTGNIHNETDYRNEEELQILIHEHPEFIAVDGSKTKLKSVGREIDTEAGRIDVLMVDSSGKLVIVEVKLGKNGDARRKVVSQIIDYVSALSRYSYYDLDNETNGNLDRTVKEFPNAEAIIPLIDNNIRSGKARLVIAMDEVNKDLLRIVQFLSDRTDFEIDVIKIKKYSLDGKEMYNSDIVFKGNETALTDQRKRVEYSHILVDEIEKKWNDEYADDKSYPKISPQQTYHHYRQIRFNGWPASLHYEFIKSSTNDYFEVRLDNETNHRRNIRDRVYEAMQKFEGNKIEGYPIELYRGAKIVTKLIIRIDDQDAQEKACDVMAKLIDLTYDTINKAVKGE